MNKVTHKETAMISTPLDSDLVELYVEEYQYIIESMIPDLSDSMDLDTYNPDRESLRDAIADTAADYIQDHERPLHVVPEIRAAADKIASIYA